MGIIQQIIQKKQRKQIEQLKGQSISEIITYFEAECSKAQRKERHYIMRQASKNNGSEYYTKKGNLHAQTLAYNVAAGLASMHPVSLYDALFHLTDEDKELILGTAHYVQSNIAYQFQPRQWSAGKFEAIHEAYHIPNVELELAHDMMYFDYVSYYTIVLETVELMQSAPDFPYETILLATFEK